MLDVMIVHAISEETDQTWWMSRPLVLEGFKYWKRGVGWGGDANRIIAGPLAGHRPLSKLLGEAPVYPLFLHLCRLNLVFARHIFYFVGFAMLWLIYI